MAFSRTPFSAHSIASERVKFSTPARAAPLCLQVAMISLDVLWRNRSRKYWLASLVLQHYVHYATTVFFHVGAKGCRETAQWRFLSKEQLQREASQGKIV